MRIGSLRQLCAVAVAAALATPAVAQNTERTFEANQGSNAARGAAGEAGTVGPAAQPGVTQPGATVRPGAPPAGTIVEQDLEGRTLNQRGERTANFPPGQGQGQRQGQGQIDDQGLVRWISASNEGEIRVNELAQQEAENEQVKQFAQKMVQEHTKFGDQLRQAAGQHGQGQQGRAGQGQQGRLPGRDATNRNTPGQDRSGLNRSEGAERNQNQQNRDDAENRADDQQINFQATQDRPRATSGLGQNQAGQIQNRQGQSVQNQGARPGHGGQAGMRGDNPFVSFHEEVAERCTQSTIEALREKDGREFDHAFMHQQVIQHMAMLDTLKVAQNHASNDLKQVLQQGEQATQQHLQQAKQLLEQVENQKQQ